MKKCIAVVAFAVILLSALFLFMRNYPSDRWFSVVFIVAGVVSLWCAWGADAAGAGAGAGVATAAECTETTTAAETETETRTDNEVSESYAQNTNKN